jgi:hypothetical protein
LEGRLRAQIEQEWKEEMEATRKREQESLNRVKVMEQNLEDKLQEVENEKLKLVWFIKGFLGFSFFKCFKICE